MNRAAELIEEVKAHVTVLNNLMEDSPVLNLKVGELGEDFIQTKAKNTEEFLCELLQVKNCYIRFSALCALLRAQNSGLKFQDKTLKQLDEFKRSKDRYKACIYQGAEKRISTEQSSA